MVQPSGGHGHGGHSHGHGHSHGKKGGKKHEDDVNMHSVFLHVLGDALGSVAVIVSGISVCLCVYHMQPVLSIGLIIHTLSMLTQQRHC